MEPQQQPGGDQVHVAVAVEVVGRQPRGRGEHRQRYRRLQRVVAAAQERGDVGGLPADYRAEDAGDVELLVLVEVLDHDADVRHVAVRRWEVQGRPGREVAGAV